MFPSQFSSNDPPSPSVQIKTGIAIYQTQMTLFLIEHKSILAEILLWQTITLRLNASKSKYFE